MSIVLWIAIAVSIVLAAAPITGGGSKVNERHLAKLVRRQGLPLPPALRTPVLGRIHARERAALMWGLGGVGVGSLAALIVHLMTGSDTQAPLLIMVAAAFGTSLGSYRGCLKAPTTLDPEAPRVARAHVTELADYTTSGERWAVRLVPAAIGVALIASLVIWFLVPVKPAGGSLTPILAILGTSAVAGVCWLLSRARTAVVDRAQQANNDLELAWDDALRAMAVRDLQESAVASGVLATLGLIAMAGTWVSSPDVRAGAESLTLVLGIFALGTGVICSLVMLVPLLIGRMHRNPSLRLWPGNQFRAA